MNHQAQVKIGPGAKKPTEKSDQATKISEILVVWLEL